MSAPKKALINAPEAVVSEAIDGLLALNPNIVRLAGLDVVLRRDFEATKALNTVAVLSGGGSGHEPGMGGFAGAGMLTAAVAGGVFASPSVESIIQAIRAATGPAGCLLVILNYTGDRLNFGLAAEQAKAEGLRVEMVVVGDDVALPAGKGIAGRRGVAGHVFVLKVAGAAAAAGATLAAVRDEAAWAARSVGTMGVALSSCTLPGQPPSSRLAAGEMEVGLGIHGEPGVATVAAAGADAVMGTAVEAILDGHWADSLGFRSGAPQRLAILVNNPGSTPWLELLVCVRAAVKLLQSRGHVVERVYSGHLLTSLDMAGVALSILRLGSVDDASEAATAALALSRLDAPTNAPGWPHSATCAVPLHSSEVPQPTRPESSSAAGDARGGPTCDAATVGLVLGAGARALAAAESLLNDLDAKCGDGDCGITMRRGSEGVLELVATGGASLGSASAVLEGVADAVRRSMGGTSGVLFDIMLRAASTNMAAASAAVASPADWVQALADGVDQMMFYSGAERGMRTMLDAAIPALEAAKAAAADGGCAALAAAAAAAEQGAEATKSMEALAGRSSYVPADVLASNADPGAVAVATLLRAGAQALGAAGAPQAAPTQPSQIIFG